MKRLSFAVAASGLPAAKPEQVGLSFGPKTVDDMTSDHLGPSISRGTFAGRGYTWGLGVAVREEKGPSPIAGSAGDYFWPGGSATYWWADPKEQGDREKAGVMRPEECRR